MKPTVGDFVMLAVIAVAAVSFYLERAVWDAHGWSRNALSLLAFAVLGFGYFGWRVWGWWKRRNSN